ncbi:MAG TPA: universal stress protein [Chitinophagaceae bacterium]|nr:universal stress protein [Chitinophagaceae bacterium]
MMKTFIVLTDFSQNAKHATEYAAQLALKRQAHLKLVHIYEPPVPVSEAEIATMYYQNMESRILKELEEEQNKLISKYQSLSVSYSIYDQPLIEQIKQLFRPDEVKLIIIGLTGSGMNNFLFGSNTLNIVLNSGCPILTIPPYTSFRPIKNFLFAFHTNNTIPSSLPIKKLKKILTVFNAQLYILQVDIPSKKTTERNKSAYEQIFQDVPHSFHIAHKKNIPAGIVNFVKTNQVDLLSIIPRKKDFWETLLGKNHTKSMLFHSDIPILSIPEKESE